MLDVSRRRVFGVLGGAAVAWPLAARGQSASIPVVGFLSGRSSAESAYLVAAFNQGLGATGYFEGQNVAIEYRWGDGQLDHLPALAAELIGRGVAAIAAVGGAEQVVRSIKTVPIVFNAGADPVEDGLVTSLNRPSGNATGVYGFYYPLEPKRLEILRELVGNATVAALIRPDALNAAARVKELQNAASALGLQVEILNVQSEREIDDAYKAIDRLRARALLVSADPYFNSKRNQLIVLSAHYGIPTLYHTREIAFAGGLMSYGASIADAYRQIGNYVGRILKGARPAELPVQQSTKVELVINMRAAKALGLDVPPTLLARADEVIE
jgi:putative ABC transport system substrate-binding protein